MASTFRILNDCVQWPQPLRSRWFVCSATCGCHADLDVKDRDQELATLEAVGPDDREGQLRTCVHTESQTKLTNPLDPDSALVMEIPCTRAKPFSVPGAAHP